jgi:hypothetical protein
VIWTDEYINDINKGSFAKRQASREAAETRTSSTLWSVQLYRVQVLCRQLQVRSSVQPMGGDTVLPNPDLGRSSMEGIADEFLVSKRIPRSQEKECELIDHQGESGALENAPLGTV